MSALHAADIRADLERGDTTGIEDAFRALVGWPNENFIHDVSEDDRRQLLRATCEAMSADENPCAMPIETFDAIMDEVEDMGGGTYSDGASAVLRTTTFFDRLSIVPAGDA